MLRISRVCLHKQSSSGSEKGRVNNEENELDDICTSKVVDTECFPPWRPFSTLGEIIMTPTAELLAEIELCTKGAAFAIASLDISQPVGGDVDEGCQQPYHQSSDYEHNPDMT